MSEEIIFPKPDRKDTGADDFWSVERLLPPKKKEQRRPSHTDTEAVEITVSAGETKSGEGEKIPQRLAERLMQAAPGTPQSEREKKAKAQIEQLMAENALRSAASMQAEQEKPPQPPKKPEAPTADDPSYDKVRAIWHPEEYTSVYDPETKQPQIKSRLQVLDSYTSENPLIPQVRISVWPSKYTFYENFRVDAEKYYRATGKPCDFVPFFAYVPQYRMMQNDQKRYYFWWRQNLREGKYLKTSLSYLLLYIYEVINLPDMTTVEQGEEQLLNVWLHYRESNERLDRYMVDWYRDYCLIHHLQPSKRLDPILDEIMELSSFKEFYVREEEQTPPYTRALFYLASNYRCRSSIYYKGASKDDKELTEEGLADRRTLFDTHIPAAFAHAIRRLSAPGGYFEQIERRMTRSKYILDAYCGSLCAYQSKRRVDMEYLTFSYSPELKQIVTDMVKYAENQVRAMLGIKARLAVKGLRDYYKQPINEYFAPLRQNIYPSKKEAEPAPYEKLYEATDTVLSPDRAATIEQSSWAVTDMLTFEEGTVLDSALAASPQQGQPPSPAASPAFSALSAVGQPVPTPVTAEVKNARHAALSALLAGDEPRFLQLCREEKRLPEAMAEQINDELFDLLGDSAVEQEQGHFLVVEDYREEIAAYLADS